MLDPVVLDTEQDDLLGDQIVLLEQQRRAGQGRHRRDQRRERGHDPAPGRQPGVARQGDLDQAPRGLCGLFGIAPGSALGDLGQGGCDHIDLGPGQTEQPREDAVAQQIQHQAGQCQQAQCHQEHAGDDPGAVLQKAQAGKGQQKPRGNPECEEQDRERHREAACAEVHQELSGLVLFHRPPLVWMA